MLKGEVVIAVKLKEYAQIHETKERKDVWVINWHEAKVITSITSCIAKQAISKPQTFLNKKA